MPSFATPGGPSIAARVARMDVDTTSGKWAHHEILGRVERGEVDILLGTQMIAKGLDFPNVTLVGVINADVSTCIAGWLGRRPDLLPVRMTLTRALHVNLRDAAGDEVSVGGGTQYDEDSAHSSGGIRPRRGSMPAPAITRRR